MLSSGIVKYAADTFGDQILLKPLKELERIQELTKNKVELMETRELANVGTHGKNLPIIAFVFGNREPSAPCFGLFGGVHGLEKIGTHLVTYFLESVVARLSWDEELQALLRKCRFVSIPLLNPGGMLRKQRSNPRGVDLMRNAPHDSLAGGPPLVRGHRLGKFLPWFRGKKDGPFEIESQALVDFVAEQMLPSSTSLALDIHSGFGVRDRLWFPYAKTKQPIVDLPVVKKIQALLDGAYPFHIYKVEPQSASYTTHGDLWDFLYDRHLESRGGDGRIFLPWTLEMGSWLWVRKNPRQFVSTLGPFNPTEPHRYRRIMRRHTVLLEFFMRLVNSASGWTGAT